MNTKLKVIVTAAGLAALTSPVMATEPTQPAAEVSHARGSAHVRHAYARARVTETPAQVTPERHPMVEDCVHVAFPQCGGDAEQSVR